LCCSGGRRSETIAQAPVSASPKNVLKTEKKKQTYLITRFNRKLRQDREENERECEESKDMP